MENVIIVNPQEFDLKKNKIIKNGFDNLHILSDFDRTLTKAYLSNGDFVPSLISILRDEDYLTREYSDKAKELFKKYHKIEIDSNIGMNEKKKAMEEWWSKHSELLIESKLNKTDINEASKSKRIVFRKYYKEIIEILEKRKVPIIILSANGLGEESCLEVLKYHNIYSKNIFILSNKYIWDKNGFAIKVVKPHIHTFNKNERIIKNSKAYSKIEHRRNIILLGDSLGDSNMAQGFEFENIIKIGFLNMHVQENLEKYKEHYDIIITNDSSAEFIVNLLNEF